MLVAPERKIWALPVPPHLRITPYSPLLPPLRNQHAGGHLIGPPAGAETHPSPVSAHPSEVHMTRFGLEGAGISYLSVSRRRGSRCVAVAAVAAAALAAAPATAQQWRDAGRHQSADMRWAPSGDFSPCSGRDGARRQSRRENLGCSSFGEAYADGEWALYNNRTWAPDSYNDWWHDRPDRAFPRWVLEQRARGTCDADRMWWSGLGWHC